jgi:hypothetical protein
LTIDGTTTYLNTDVYTTEKLNVTNSGLGPALTITQTSQTNNIMNISNYNSEVFNIANNGTITTNNNNINAGSGTITAATFSGNATTATTATTANNLTNAANITTGTINSDRLPIAGTETVGGLKVDGIITTISNNTLKIKEPVSKQQVENVNSAIQEFPPIRNFSTWIGGQYVAYSGQEFTVSGQGYGNGIYTVYYVGPASHSSVSPSSIWAGDGYEGKWSVGYDTAGNYVRNPAASIVDDSSYYGDGVSIKFPNSIKITSYKIRATVNIFLGPKDFKIYGSKDSITWVPLDVKENISYDANRYYEGSIITTESYNHFALTVKKIGTGGNSLQIQEWRIYGNLVNTYNYKSNSIVKYIAGNQSDVNLRNTGSWQIVDDVLPIATNSVLGGVKKGNNINITGDGTISVDLLSYSGDSTINGNLFVNSNLIVHGETTTLNTDVYTTERLEITNGGTASSTFSVRQTASGNANNILNVINSTTSNVFNITSAGNIGIGTTNPANRLDIQGGAAQTLRILDTRAAGDAIVALKELNDNNGFDMAYIGTTGDRFYIRGYNNSATPRVDLAIDRITSNVGIGMTDPKYKLDVAGTINASNILINGSIISASSSQWITSGTNIYNNNTGNIGIGRTNPTELLHVNGNFKAEGSIVSGSGADMLSGNHIFTTATSGRLGIGINPNNPTTSIVHLHRTTANTEVKLQFTDGTTLSTATDGLTLYKGTDQIGYLWNYENADLVFGTNSTERMRITSSGNIGIGTNPSYKCHIKCSYDNVATGLHLDADDGSANPDKYALTIWPYVIAGGSVGWKFRTQSLTGGVNTPLEFTNTGSIRFKKDIWHSDSDGNARFYYANADKTYIKGYGTTPIEFRNGADTTVATFSSAGNLTIAGSELYVGPDSGSSKIFLGGGAAGDPGYNHSVIESRNYSSTENTELLLFKGNDVGSPDTADRIRLRAGAIVFDTYPGASVDRAAENIRMVINGSGNVGIANNAPIGPLTIGNSALANNDGFMVLEKCTTVGSSRQFRIGLNANFDFAIGDYGANNTAGTWVESFKIAYNAPVNSLVILGTGNVGIGINPNASYKLDVNGNVYAGNNSYLLSTHTETGARQFFGKQYNGEIIGGMEIENTTLGGNWSQKLHFTTHHYGASWGRRMTIAENGNVGIGTVTPSSYNLQVIGTIGATGNITAFYSDERLKTVTEYVSDVLPILSKIRVFRYNCNDLAASYGYDKSKKEIGLSAQEVQKYYPEVVSIAPFDSEYDEETKKIVSKSGENYLTLDYERLVPVLIQGIKDLNNVTISQQSKITDLEERLARLEKLIIN